jgi:hypothetical protein
LVIGRHQSLLATQGDNVVGILRLSDVYHVVLELMRKCEVAE